MTTQNLKFDRQFFHDLWQLLKPYWFSEEKWSALTLLLVNISCIIAQVRVSVALNSFYKDFFNALQGFDKHDLMQLMVRFAIIVAISIVVFGYNIYFNGLLTIRWRRWLTHYYTKNWLHNHAFYRLQILNKNIDNPDQRISEDLANFPSATLSLLNNLLGSILTLISFGIILWGLSENLNLPIGNGKYLLIPGYLLLSALLYAAIGTWLTRLIGRKLAGLNYQQQRYNADFRFNLVRTREASEQIALYRGQAFEQNKLATVFNLVFGNFLNLIQIQKRLTFFENGYYAIAYLIGLTVGMPLYFAKKIHIGGITQISGAFGQVISALSLIIFSFTAIADWRSIIYRLTEFSHSLQEVNHPLPSTQIQIGEHHKSNLIIHNLTLYLPDSSPLLQHFQLTIESSARLLLTGPSGVGKSTLLRALAGLWPHGEGQIYLPINKKMMFLPQKPYLPLGTLRETLTYPFAPHTFTEATIQKTLRLCHLDKLRDELDHTRDWSHELSLGEQQLIAFARIFLQQPDWIFLDEATSALDEALENQIYQTLYQQLPTAAVISVGHRSTLNNFHELKIELAPEFTSPALAAVGG